MRASDPRPAPVPTKRRRLRTHGMDEAGGIRLPAGADAAAAAEEAPSPPASAPSPEAVLIAAAVVDRRDSGRARGGAVMKRALTGAGTGWPDAVRFGSTRVCSVGVRVWTDGTKPPEKNGK